MGFFDRDISNALLGKRVREAQDRHRLYVAQNTPLWQQEGAQMRARRESQKISQAELSELVGVCTQTLRRLEEGKSVKRRDMMKTSYQTAVNFILLQREVALKNYNS